MNSVKKLFHGFYLQVYVLFESHFARIWSSSSESNKAYKLWEKLNLTQLTWWKICKQKRKWRLYNKGRSDKHLVHAASSCGFLSESWYLMIVGWYLYKPSCYRNWKHLYLISSSQHDKQISNKTKTQKKMSELFLSPKQHMKLWTDLNRFDLRVSQWELTLC